VRAILLAAILVAIALVPTVAARPPVPPGCDPGACQYTILVPPGMTCPEAGHYEYTKVGPVRIGVLHCDPGTPP
jgi:hypothetical protein